MRAFIAEPQAVGRMAQRREILGRHKEGAEFPAEISVAKAAPWGRPVFTVILRDMTRRKQLEAEPVCLSERRQEALRYQTLRDALTGLFKRRYLEETLPHELHRALRRQWTVAVSAREQPFPLFDQSSGSLLQSRPAAVGQPVYQRGTSL